MCVHVAMQVGFHLSFLGSISTHFHKRAVVLGWGVVLLNLVGCSTKCLGLTCPCSRLNRQNVTTLAVPDKVVKMDSLFHTQEQNMDKAAKK